MSNSTTNFYDLRQSFSFSDVIVISTYFLLNLAVGIWVSAAAVDVIFRPQALETYQFCLSVLVQSEQEHSEWILLGWSGHGLVAGECAAP